MQLKTILNHVEKQPGFVYGEARLVKGGTGSRIEVEMRPRQGSRARCGQCLKPASLYDVLPKRRWQFVPLWGITVLFVYARRRVECRRCGVKAEALPWADGKQTISITYAWFLARWAKRLSWLEVARTFGTSWNIVYRAVTMAVEWGRARVDLSTVCSLGVDEVAWQKGHRYLTVVYDVGKECCRLLWVGRGREEATLHSFFDWLGSEVTERLRFVVSDMWQPYLKVIGERAKQAVQFLDRYHVAAKMNKAIDETRAKEAKELKSRGEEPVLSKTRWCLLKRPKNLTPREKGRLKELLQLNLRTVRAYLLKESFQLFWKYRSPFWAGRFLDSWCGQAMRSRIEPMKKIARSLRAHRPLLLNWFRARDQLRAGATEGMNNALKVATRRAYGYRSFKVVEIALYHALGNLPEPERTHKFC